MKINLGRFNMIGSINNVNSLNSISSVRRNNVSFGKKKTYTTTTTVTEGQPKEKKGFLAKIGLAIVAFFGALFTFGAISDKAKAKKPEGEKPAEDKKLPVTEEKPADETDKKTEVTSEEVVEEFDVDAELKTRREAEQAQKENAASYQTQMDDLHGINKEPKSAEESAEVFGAVEESAAEAGVVVDTKEDAQAKEAVEAPVEELADEASVDAVAPEADNKKQVTQAKEAVEAPVEELADEASVDAVAPEVDNKKQTTQAMITAGMAGALGSALVANNDEISAVEYADAQKAQLRIATPVKSTATPKTEVKAGNDGFEFDSKMETQMLEDAFEVSLKGEETASGIKATLKEYRQYVKEADKNDFGDIQTKDGGIVAFEKRVEYPAGETTGIVDEAITKHTREQEKQEILTATKLDAQGNISGIATYVNGRIDSLTEYTKDGKMNILQADNKGVLLAKGMKQTEAGFAFDEIMNFDYVGDVRRLVSCAKGVTIENGTTTIEKAYKYDNDNNLKEFAKEVVIGADNSGSLAHDFQFESDNLVAAASLYSGDFSAFGKGVAADVFTFENGEITSHGKMCEYTVNA